MFEPNSTIGWPVGRLRESAAGLVRFVRAPVLHSPDWKTQGPASDLIWLFAVNCLIVVCLAAILFPALLAFDVEMSGDMTSLFDRPVWQILAIVVVVGPIIEELVFRSWITGQPRLLIPLGGVALAIAGGQLIGFSNANQLIIVAAGALLMLVTLFAMIRFWNRPVPGWYARIFPLVFWTQALLFGFVHIFNYAGDNPAALLPFVLPQLVGGLVWGYARIRYGWWSNIIMHMAYNLIATSGLLFMLLAGPRPA
ncbi:CPBP family glutamic-type intramembrane protease [Parasphingorhabdus marina]|nr:CPBP family glutamic-type intramembrane protease [Parasphingorhabdus marina]